MNMCCTTCNQSQPNKSCPACAYESEEELTKCVECLDEYPEDELHETSNGLLCDLCFQIYKQECI